MKKIRLERARKDGWTRWVRPVMRGYLMQCCNCDLIHEVEFAAVRITKIHEDGRKEGETLDPGEYQVEFRMKCVSPGRPVMEEDDHAQ